ncbi:MAG: alpha/beta hydrolase [Candidatus Aenigmatarchaeota archaeon]
MVFFPSKELWITPEQFELPFKDVYIKTIDKVMINGWFIQKDGSYTLLFFHGNAGNIGDRLEKLKLLYNLGLNIFIIDYRGYGKSNGKSTERGLYIDALASYNYLKDSFKISSENIILYGESLGCSIAIDLATKVKVAGLILEGSFSSGEDMAKLIIPFIPSFLFHNKFNSLKKIKNIDAPKLFLHSLDDEVVPFKLAKKLYSISKEPKKFVELRGSHNSAFLDSKEIYLNAIFSFLEDLIK